MDCRAVGPHRLTFITAKLPSVFPQQLTAKLGHHLRVPDALLSRLQLAARGGLGRAWVVIRLPCALATHLAQGLLHGSCLRQGLRQAELLQG